MKSVFVLALLASGTAEAGQHTTANSNLRQASCACGCGAVGRNCGGRSTIPKARPIENVDVLGMIMQYHLRAQALHNQLHSGK